MAGIEGGITEMYTTVRHAIVLMSITAVVTPSAAIAQSSGLELEEIVVTAQKREQNLNDVGIAVTAFTGNDARSLGFGEPLDVAAQTPNLNINDTFGRGIANVSIRGVGLNDYAVNNNPAAGIYIDEVYLVSPAMLSFQLFDLERIEVLRGPQGTLYGKNTTAGTVKFVSAKPTEETTGYLSVNYGRFDRVALEGAVGGQITDTFGIRVAGQTIQQGDGHQFNRTTGSDVGDVDRTAYRVILDWAPTDKLNFLLNLHGGQDTSDSVLFNINNVLDPSDDGFFGQEYSSAGAGPIRTDSDNFGASLVVNLGLNDQWSLTSVTGFEDFSRFYQEDRDGSALVHLDGFYANEIEQFSQELRATYVGENTVLILGGFIGTDDVDTRDQFDATDLLPLFGLGGSTGAGNFYFQETDSQALFAHTEWQLNSDWRLNLGLRYTKDEKDFSNAFTFIVVPDLATGGGGLCPLLPAGNPGVVPTTDGFQIQCFPAVTSNYDVSDTSGRIGIDYTGFDNALIYASVSTGFKSGGFQGQLTFNPADLAGFQEENLLAYEVGFKSTLADSRVQLNGSVFFYDFEDLQFYGPLFDSPFGPLFGIANAGDAEISGAELEMNWLATEGLTVQLGLGLLDTEITESVLPGVVQGSELPNSPEVNFNATVDYSWDIGNLRANFLLATAYKDDVNYDIVRLPPETMEDGYWLINARLGVSDADGVWSAYLWAKNLGDERYRVQVSTTSVGFAETWGLPATYGVGFDFEW